MGSGPAMAGREGFSFARRLQVPVLASSGAAPVRHLAPGRRMRLHLTPLPLPRAVQAAIDLGHCSDGHHSCVRGGATSFIRARTPPQ